ncbi:hypothetical protein PAAG_08321 [Paracoccidioides lutzii Pb01]|uniref:Uncharacterized protein n=1 Tax=Paracoccidioides lutzii (strain ATCC MYA-826 / Pb01) TaxID=502779 RepID=C1HC30_PARBA|nr:hypothetical protein PAAG_08321 [Paracoccidioides lutzii Pb01]EEH38594.2 hypothetical protein PAAG_08321 [Paracoccidioides lutzii Pb01]
MQNAKFEELEFSDSSGGCARRQLLWETAGFSTAILKYSGENPPKILVRTDNCALQVNPIAAQIRAEHSIHGSPCNITEANQYGELSNLGLPRGANFNNIFPNKAICCLKAILGPITLLEAQPQVEPNIPSPHWKASLEKNSRKDIIEDSKVDSC